MAKKNKRKKRATPAVVTKTPESKKKKAIRQVGAALPNRWNLIIATGLAILAMVVYAPGYDFDFVYDDDAVITHNRYVKQGLEGLDEIWSTSYFQGYDETMIARAFRPVPLTTLALEVELFGLNRKVHHTANLFIYGLTGFFLFLFLSRLMRGLPPFVPVATTLLFLVHPIHLEVVANIKSRDTMLGFLGVCLAGLFLLKYLDRKKTGLLLLSLVFYFLGLFSKEEVITTLAGFPLMLWFFRKYKAGKIAKTRLPYLGAVIVFLIYRSKIVGGLNAGVTLTYLDNSLLAANGFAERTASHLLVLGNYLLKTVFPHPLISDYSYLTLPLVQWDDWRVYGSLLANLGLLALGIRGLWRREVYGFGPLWYFTSVSIFTSLVVTNVSAYNDRFLYVPVLGIVFLIAWGGSLLLRHPPKGQKETAGLFFKNNFIPVAIIVLLSAVGIYKIESHLPVWQNRYTLFEHDVKAAPQNVRMRKNYGGFFARLAVARQVEDPQLARQYAQQALEQLDSALAVYPRLATGLIHKGNMHIILNEYDKAIEALKKAINIAPSNYYAKASLGNVYYRTGKYEDAIRIIESIPRHLRQDSDRDVLQRAKQRVGRG